MGVHWLSHTPETTVLERVSSVSIEALIHHYQLQWTGHVIQLKYSRIPKLYGELAQGMHPRHKPIKRFKD